ncbi:phage repressor protein [Streptococcus parauberis]|uniref:LexA family transcriptional regulator n=1 Tax=Streptococcus parauberis TaxID=1348 RepID=UPI00020CBC17|nr:helix-turn-helix transcriptional regulator [Streptococcus parauberis]AEF25749.1 putative repressor protein [Streptococcus parauberis KCTC 11537]QBX18236.1 pleiotropic regulator of exopolysaccharide synthesis, competence and biofilm formation [Streptococcus phage Javan407]QBX27397.1 pleiotropic regulator of exopolysaccharide synthesis, competence and biofilm formation [Streptococcus phage Javan384]OHY31283.1 phage repressor protein [Streptococcus parauberis]UWM90556.1 XRE family transcriptio
MELNKFVGSKIKEFRLEKKLTQSQLADILETTKQTISRYEKGDRKVSQDTLFDLTELFGKSIDDFFPQTTTKHELKIPTSPLVNKITNKVVELNVPRKQKVLDFATNQLKEQNNKITSIKEHLYEYKVYEKLSAGTGYGYFGDGNYDTVFYDEKMDYDFASWVFGDSMEPAYLNGEVVLIKQTGFDYDGGIYAVEWDGQTYIKKVYREENGLRLVSLNKKYNDKFASFDEDPRIIGKIVGNFMPKDY